MSIPDSVRERVRAQARNRCGYCLSRQELVLGVLEIDHIIPTGAGGLDDEENLWLACRACNLAAILTPRLPSRSLCETAPSCPSGWEDDDTSFTILG